MFPSLLADVTSHLASYGLLLLLRHYEPSCSNGFFRRFGLRKEMILMSVCTLASNHAQSNIWWGQAPM
jgi:hypothetical protein